jgi:hypothetical protein
MNDLNQEFSQHTGSENYYTNWLIKPFKYTDGVKDVADKYKAYWLIEAICSYKRREKFQAWELVVNNDKTAILTMQEDIGKPILVNQKIKFTTFPKGKIKIWVVNEVVLLPDEY